MATITAFKSVDHNLLSAVVGRAAFFTRYTLDGLETLAKTYTVGTDVSVNTGAELTAKNAHNDRNVRDHATTSSGLYVYETVDDRHVRCWALGLRMTAAPANGGRILQVTFDTANAVSSRVLYDGLTEWQVTT